MTASPDIITSFTPVSRFSRNAIFLAKHSRVLSLDLSTCGEWKTLLELFSDGRAENSSIAPTHDNKGFYVAAGSTVWRCDVYGSALRKLDLRDCPGDGAPFPDGGMVWQDILLAADDDTLAFHATSNEAHRFCVLHAADGRPHVESDTSWERELKTVIDPSTATACVADNPCLDQATAARLSRSRQAVQAMARIPAKLLARHLPSGHVREFVPFPGGYVTFHVEQITRDGECLLLSVDRASVDAVSGGSTVEKIYHVYSLRDGRVRTLPVHAPYVRIGRDRELFCTYAENDLRLVRTQDAQPVKLFHVPGKPTTDAVRKMMIEANPAQAEWADRFTGTYDTPATFSLDRTWLAWSWSIQDDEGEIRHGTIVADLVAEEYTNLDGRWDNMAFVSG